MPDKHKADTSSLTSTRQLLDELDALMERMLALPVGESSGAAAKDEGRSTSVAEAPEPPHTSPGRWDLPVPPTESPPETHANAPPDAPAHQGALTGYRFIDAPAEPGPSAHEEAVPVRTMFVSSPPKTPLPEEPAEAPPPEPKAVAAEVLSALASRKPNALAESLLQHSQILSGKPRRRLPLLLQPLALLNRAFDACTYLLGPLGRWLRQPGGRTALGLLGVCLILAAAIVYVAFWLPWE